MAGYPGNFVDSGIKTVPNRLRTASNAPTTKLAYITPEEEGILQALKPGTPHKGPMGIPNYDSVDWDPTTGQYSVVSGGQASQMESGMSASDAGLSQAQQAAYETSKPGGWTPQEIAQSEADLEADKPWTVQDGQWVAPGEKPIETKLPKEDPTIFEAAQDWFKKSAFYGMGKGVEALLYKLALRPYQIFKIQTSWRS